MAFTFNVRRPISDSSTQIHIYFKGAQSNKKTKRSVHFCTFILKAYFSDPDSHKAGLSVKEPLELQIPRENYQSMKPKEPKKAHEV